MATQRWGGHTHYGQIAIPKWNWNIAGLFLEHSMGTHRIGDSLLYINPGTNYWGIPLRIGTPPEVTVVTLRRGGATGYLKVQLTIDRRSREGKM